MTFPFLLFDISFSRESWVRRNRGIQVSIGIPSGGAKGICNEGTVGSG